jgi:alkanesulfonate monooxygenase SsuD/methylene tetrahydromethanopterin reductase-like flavin-dependent oxidoreductase (luciferase family)
MSGHRLVLGVGAGWMREEFAAVEQPFEGRGRRLDEMLEVIQKLWRGDGYAEHHGELFDFAPLEMRPIPSEPVPIWVGGTSAAARRRAASRADGWISDLHTTSELARIVRDLRALRQDSPRAGEPFAVLGASRDAHTLDGYRRLADAGVTHAQTLPWTLYGLPGATLDERREGIARFAEDVIQKLG